MGAGRGRPTGASSTTALGATRRPALVGAQALVWWDEEAGGGPATTSPTFPSTSARTTAPPADAQGMDANPGDAPFIMMADGLGWLFAPSGLLDGPLPTHYEPLESPVRNLLYPEHRREPGGDCAGRGPTTRYAAPDDPRYPLVATTFRLTEHHTAGGMSRTLPWLGELQPEMFAEIDPELAAERGIEDGGWMTIVTAARRDRGARAGDRRIRPLRLDGRASCTRWPCRSTGATAGPYRGDCANDLGVLSGRAQRLDPGVQGVHLRRARGAAPRRHHDARCAGAAARAAACAPTRTTTWPRSPRRRPREHDRAAHRDRRPARRRRAHGLLHRHDDVHRLQGVRGGLQAVERPAGRRLASSARAAPTTTPASCRPPPGATCASSSG